MASGLRPIRSIATFGSSDFLLIPEASGQTFPAGAVVTINAGGFLTEAVTNPTGIIGIAQIAGQNTVGNGDAKTPVVLIQAASVYEGTLDTAGSLGANALVQADLFSRVGLTKDATTGIWYLDRSKTLDLVRAYIIAFTSAVGDKSPRVHFQFIIGAAAQGIPVTLNQEVDFRNGLFVDGSSGIVVDAGSVVPRTSTSQTFLWAVSDVGSASIAIQVHNNIGATDPVITLRRSRGTFVSATPAQTGDVLGTLFLGQSLTTVQAFTTGPPSNSWVNGVAFESYAVQNWSIANTGTAWGIYSTPINTGTPLFTIAGTSNNNVQIGNKLLIGSTGFPGVVTEPAVRCEINELTAPAANLGSEVLRVRQAPAATTDNPNRSTFFGDVKTTDATVTTIITIPIIASRTYGIRVRVVGRRTGGGGTADDGTFIIRNAMVTTKTGTVTVNTTGTSDSVIRDIGTTDVTFAISGSNLLIRVTGVAATNYSWSAVADVGFMGS